jgi:shikimate dehydrogenase
MFSALFLLGDPVDHSLSPEMQRRALAWAGIRGAYVPIRVGARELRAAVEALGRLGFVGGNVTVPHKERALALADGVTERARAIGAVNVLFGAGGGRAVRGGRRRRGAAGRGGFRGDNTDGEGFLRALRERAGIAPRGRRVLLLGAGGAARAVLHAVLTGGAAEVLVLNRTARRGAALARAARAWNARGRVAHGPLALAAALARPAERERFDLVVNATSVGLRGERAALVPAALVGRAAVVADLAYGARETRLVREARARGVRVVDGLDVLVGQGGLAFDRWFGVSPPWGVLEREVRAAWRRRRGARG